jgi:hypothetical protein
MRVAFWKSRGLFLFAGVWLVYSTCPPFLSYDSYTVLLFSLPGMVLACGRRWCGRLSPYLAAFVALAGCGILVHGRGATSMAANQRSAPPRNVDYARWRVWDWRDAQFLKGLR